MKKRTVVIIIVVAAAFLVFAFVSILIILGLAGEGNLQFTGFGPKVAVVEVYGEIINSQDVCRQIRKWSDDGSVKAIVIHIDSPGGGVAASQEIYDEIIKAREKDVVVVASMATVAASGGYYIACAADKIVANPGTLTGSIGVILSFPTAKELMEKIGLQWEVVKSGELKDVGSFTRPMTAEEDRMLRAVVDDAYEQFVEAIADGRDRDKNDIYPYADGSIFTGRQAYNHGLVDTLGTFQDAVDLAGQMSGIGTDPDIIRERKRKPGLIDLLGTTLQMINEVAEMEVQQPSLMYLYR